LEACYFKFPQYRTQGPQDHALMNKMDVCGRNLEQLRHLVAHDRMTMLSQFVFSLAIYFAIPGYYPARMTWHADALVMRIGKLILNHYVMSFGMYWGHRAYHQNPFLWKYLHSVHHYARHPLSRNTYEDHWLENLVNHVAGHFAAQILVPLSHDMFWFSHIFRILESLEKHSGISCYLNLAHQLSMSIFPFAQMPHHHDWHHEGHKACNFTFSSLGGFWDGVFKTRKHGRCEGTTQATRHDVRQMGVKEWQSARGWINEPLPVLLPSIAFSAVWIAKLVSVKADLS